MSETKINLLDVIPKLKDHITLYVKDDEKVRLGIRRFKNEWFHKHFFPNKLSREVSVNFDQYGSAVLKLIDGKTKVADILALLESLSIDTDKKEQQERVLLFIKHLHRDKLIDYLI